MIEAELASAGRLEEPRRLLEEGLRSGEPMPDAFVERLREAVHRGDIEALVARSGGEALGVAVVAYRPSFSLGGSFASVEELYVRPGVRRCGVGRRLMEAVEGRCVARGVSYVEVQTEGEAEGFYAALGYEPEEDVRVLSRSLAIGG